MAQTTATRSGECLRDRHRLRATLSVSLALLTFCLGACSRERTPDETKAVAPQENSTAKNLYLDLMKLTLTDLIYEQNPKARAMLRQDKSFWEDVKKSGDVRYPSRAHTMIGVARLHNIQVLVEDAIARQVPGDLIEAGAWRGGATIFMRAVLKANDVTDRLVWVADSFEGLPPPDPEKYPVDANLDLSEVEELAVSLEEVQQNFERYGLLDNQVRFLKGWFKDTLPSAPIDKLAIVRIDADLYESTMDALIHLYPKIPVGGYVIIDDYGILFPCQKAVKDYRAEHGITEKIETIDFTGIYWKKEHAVPAP